MPLLEIIFNSNDPHYRDGCTENEVTWPDLQRTFRRAVCEASGVPEWKDEMDMTYNEIWLNFENITVYEFSSRVRPTIYVCLVRLT